MPLSGVTFPGAKRTIQNVSYKCCQRQEVLNRTLGDGFSLPDLLANVARHFLTRAMEEAAGNKSRAANLVGLSSYQTLTNWLSKYGVGR